MKYTLCLMGTLLLYGSAFGQGAIDGFFARKGVVDIAASLGVSTSDRYYTTKEPIDYDRDQLIFSVFANYGITDKWNVITNLPIINFKPQDAVFYTKYRLLYKDGKSGKFTVAPAFGFSFPMSNYETESGQAIGQKAVTLQPKLLFQYESKKRWFVQAQAGYTYAFDPVPSSSVYSAKIGYMFGRMYFDAWYEYQLRNGGQNWGVSEPLDNFRTLGVTHSRVGAVAFWQFHYKMGIGLNGGYILDGENVGDAIQLGFSFVHKFGKLDKPSE